MLDAQRVLPSPPMAITVNIACTVYTLLYRCLFWILHAVCMMDSFEGTCNILEIILTILGVASSFSNKYAVVNVINFFLVSRWLKQRAL